jgi:hypothetical protein
MAGRSSKSNNRGSSLSGFFVSGKYKEYHTNQFAKPGGFVLDGLTAYLDANDPTSYSGSGTAWNDISGNNNNATLINGPTYSTDNGGAIVFDGSNDYASFGTAEVMNLTAYTKYIWMRPQAISSNNLISSPGGGGNHVFWMNGTNNTIAGGNNGQYTQVSYSLPSGNMLNQWQNAVLTYDDSSGLVLYLNGTQVDSNNSSNTFTQKTSYIASFSGGNVFNGEIAQVAIYDRALSAAEVLKNYNTFKNRFGY